MVHSSITQIPSYRCLPFTKSQTPQQPVALSMLVDFKDGEQVKAVLQGVICITPSHPLLWFSQYDLQLGLS